MTFLYNNPSSASDEELLLDYKKNGDMESLSRLYQRHLPLVYGVCLKYLQNTDDAKDASINLYEELVLKLKKHEIQYFKAWLYQVAKNHCLMALRTKKKNPTIFITDDMQFSESQHPEEVILKEKRLKTMEECIEKLNDMQKETITMFYLKGKCYKEIATFTGSNTEKVRSHIQNGRRNLKICMEEQETENKR